MEKKEPISSNPRGVCEKLFDAITVSPGFRQFRRISFHSQDPVAPAAAPHRPPASSVDAVPKIVPVQTEKPEPGKGKHVPVTERVPAKGDPQPMVPLSFPPVSEPAPVKPKKKLDSDSPMKTVVHKGKESGKVNQLQGKREEDKKPTKVEVPEVAPPIKGEGEKKGGLANINEKANDYIARARMKIRHTTTIAGADRNARTTSF